MFLFCADCEYHLISKVARQICQFQFNFKRCLEIGHYICSEVVQSGWPHLAVLCCGHGTHLWHQCICSPLGLANRLSWHIASVPGNLGGRMTDGWNQAHLLFSTAELKIWCMNKIWICLQSKFVWEISKSIIKKPSFLQPIHTWCHPPNSIRAL